ncbi:M1 family metallopeptidase [Massilia sp. B-10]|nr:M1 family metallopeptidase [Massilia sp. B-10]
MESEDQAADAFDDIPYVKGQAVVRMLEAWLGEDSFRRGVRAYMAAHRFGNTTGANLWVALEKASGKPVARLATDWTAQPGYPLLKVAQVCEQGWRRITLSQEQYWLDEQLSRGAAVAGAGGAGGRGRQDHVHAADGPEHDHLPARLRGHAGGRSGGVGYYRVQYDSASFAALAANSAKLGDSARLRLLSDTWSQAQSGRQPLGAWAALAATYQNESRAAIWRALASQLQALDAMADGTPEQAAVRRFARTLAAPAFARLGWDEKAGESVDQRALRPLLATLLIRAGDEPLIAQGRERFARFQQDAATVAVGHARGRGAGRRLAHQRGQLRCAGRAPGAVR